MTNKHLQILTWHDFDWVVYKMGALIEDMKKRYYDSGNDLPLGLYGESRGGLPLAVALSHRTGLPLEQYPQQTKRAVIWVDDIFETGRTYYEFCATYGTPYGAMTWIGGKTMDENLQWAIPINPMLWYVFPWEDLSKAQKDCEEYTKSRSEV